MTSPSIVALHVGQPQALGALGPEDPFGEPWPTEGERWTSGIFKVPVEGPVSLTARGFDGDGQADVVKHGGLDKAVCAYPADHYPEWRRTLGITPFDFGAFGENLTIDGLDEQTVCIGDVWSLVDAQVQVSVPRSPALASNLIAG